MQKTFSGIILMAMMYQSLLQKAVPKQGPGHLLRRLLQVCCFTGILDSYRTNPDLKGTKPIGIIEGQQRIIKPSMKARAAADSIMSACSEPGVDLEDEHHGSQKRKRLANTKAHISVAPAPKAPPRKCAKKAVVVESDNETTEDGADEVDAYERLQEQRKTDRLVSVGTDQ